MAAGLVGAAVWCFTTTVSRGLRDSVAVLGQPQQHRHGQQRMTVKASQRLDKRLQGRHSTSVQHPMLLLAPAELKVVQWGSLILRTGSLACAGFE